MRFERKMSIEKELTFLLLSDDCEGFVAPETAVNFSDCQSSECHRVSQRLAFVPQVELES